MLAAFETVQSSPTRLRALHCKVKFANYINRNVLKVPAVHTNHITSKFTVYLPPVKLQFAVSLKHLCGVYQ